MQLAQEWPFLEVRLVFFLAWLSQICGMRKMSGQKQELIFSRSGFGGETATFDIFGVLSLLLIMGRAKPGLLLLLLLLLLLMQLKEKLRNWRSERDVPRYLASFLNFATLVLVYTISSENKLSFG